MSEDRSASESSNDAESLPTEVGRTEKGEAPATMGTLIVSVLAYTVARLVLVVAIAAVIYFVGQAVSVNVPVLVAAVFGVLIALPLGLVLFKPLRLRVNDQIARVDAERSARRDDLSARLRGDQR